MSSIPKFPQTLIAVSVSAVDPSARLPRVAEIVNHMSQLAPVFLAMHTLCTAAPSLVEHVIVFFDSFEAAQMVIACFDGCCWNETTSLSVQLSERQPLQLLAQALAKSSATASSRPEPPPAILPASGQTPETSAHLNHNSSARLQPAPQTSASWHPTSEPSRSQAAVPPSLSNALLPASHLDPPAATSAPAVPNAQAELAAATASIWSSSLPLDPLGSHPSRHSMQGWQGQQPSLHSHLHSEHSLHSPLPHSFQSQSQQADHPLHTQHSQHALPGLALSAPLGRLVGQHQPGANHTLWPPSHAASTPAQHPSNGATGHLGLLDSSGPGQEPWYRDFIRQEQQEEQAGDGRLVTAGDSLAYTQQGNVGLTHADSAQRQGVLQEWHSSVNSGTTSHASPAVWGSQTGRAPPGDVGDVTLDGGNDLRRAAAVSRDVDAETQQLHRDALLLRQQQDDFLAQHRASHGACTAAVPAPVRLNPYRRDGTMDTASSGSVSGNAAVQLPAAVPAAQPPKQAQQGWAAVAAAGVPAGGEGGTAQGLSRKQGKPADPSHQVSLTAECGGVAGGSREGGGSCGVANGRRKGGDVWELVGKAQPGKASSSTSSTSEVGGGSRIYVSGIKLSAKTSQVEEVFAKFGALREVVKFPEARYAFVSFHKPDAAAAALQSLHDTVVSSLSEGSQPLRIEYRAGDGCGSSKKSTGGGGKACAGRGGRLGDDADEPTTKLWVAGIAEGVSEEGMRRVLGRFGPVREVQLRPAPEAGRKDQWAFVNFKRVEDSVKARRAFHDQVVPDLSGGARLKIKFKQLNGMERGGSGGT